MKYIIYESALTSSIENQKSNGDVVEFITVLQEADVKNRNGRIYPKTVIEEGLKGPMIQEKLAKHSLFGEAGHPYSQEVSRQTQVDLRNAAFMIEDFWWEGNLLKAKCKTLDTALGRDMAGLIKEGCELSFSMRGQGNVARDPYRDALVVKSPLMIITYDWVYLPSHDKAYMESICEETKESMFNTKAYDNMATALNESYNLYENGSLVEIENSKPIEKPMKDYYSNYRKSFKLLEESYQYDPADKIKEMTNTYVILENENELKKVAKEDYLLKNIRSEMKLKESVCDIAPLDNMAGAVTEPLTDKDLKTGLDDLDDMQNTQKIGVDVKPVIVEDTIDEAMPEPQNAMSKEIADKGLDQDGVAVPVESHTEKSEEETDDHKEEIKEGFEIPEIITDTSSRIQHGMTVNKKLFDDIGGTANTVQKVTDIAKKEEELKKKYIEKFFKAKKENPEKYKDYTLEDFIKEEMAKDNKTIKEEFMNFYNMISEETDLTESYDIIERALSYTNYMSEECAELFYQMHKEGDR